MTFLTLQQLITVADAVLQPPEDVFADASGTPSDDLERQSAAKFHSLAVSAFTTLCSYLADLPASQPQAQPIAEQASPLIQELTAAEAAAHETAVHQQKLILKSCQAALLYAKDDGLLTPWSSHQLHLASSSLLNALSPSQHAAIGKTSHSCTSVSHNVQQDLLIYLLPALLPVTSAGSQAKDSYDDIDFNADQGLGTFQKCLQARQVACLIRQLDYQHLSKQIDQLLPQVLALVKDQSPAVQCYGLQALHHLAQEALPADLKSHQRQLMTVARDILVGCEDTVWPIAAPSACVIVCALGTSGQQPGYVDVMQELLKQAEMQAHKPARILVWLQAIKPVFAVLGLQTLRFFTALMPLVLRWCHDPDLAIQLGALQVLQEIVKGTWPRMNAHASSLWGHLQQILAQHDEDCLSRNSTEVLEHSVCAHSHIKGCLCKIAEMLFWCGGSELQQQLHALKQTGQCDARELLQNLPGVQEVAVA